MGNPGFTEGGSPVTDYVAPVPADSYLTVDGVGYLVIDHTAELALGENDGDYTISFALI